MQYLLGIAVLLVLVGCEQDTTETVESKTVTIPSDSYIELDDNQTIGYPKGSEVNIINNSDGSYYVYCPEGECDVAISSPTTTETNVYQADSNKSVEDNTSL